MMKLGTAMKGLAVLLATVPVAAHAAPSTSPESFTISAPSKIPGAVLEPGTYSIQVVNRLSDRIILKVVDGAGDVHAVFLGIPDAKLARPASSGPVTWANAPGGTSYLKGWYFPKSRAVVEFVYPKNDAVAIATSNPAKVPAVDPASEGKPADNTLSQHDMQLLTLWQLHLDKVEGAQPAIKAERYQQQVASEHRQVVSALPHTAGWTPLVWVIGMISLGMAALLSLRRYSGAA